MENPSSEIKVRDMRKKDKFQVDDEYLNGYAKLCGPHATLVYLCLCRHADFHTQTCYPSVQTMADKLGISIASVKRGLVSLVEWKIITKERVRKNDDAKWENNEYTLVDKTLWKEKPQLNMSHGSHSSNRSKATAQSHSSNRATKVYTVEGYTIEGIASASPPPEFSFQEYLKRMHEHPQRQVQVIAFYFQEKKLSFDNLAQAQTAIRRHLRAAKDLVPFSDKQLIDAAKKAAREWPQWTLDTLVKILTR